MMTETQWWSMLFMNCWQDICVSCHKHTRVGCVWEQRCLEWNKSQVYVQAWWYYITKGDPMYTLIILLAMRVGNMRWILCSDWQPKWSRWANLVHSGLPSLFLCKKKWTYKVSNFCIMSVIKLQKAKPKKLKQPFWVFYTTNIVSFLSQVSK